MRQTDEGSDSDQETTIASRADKGDRSSLGSTIGPLLRRCRLLERRWWVSFVLLFALGGLWSLGSPLFSAPDEPAHVVKAAAVVRGQFFPLEMPTPDGLVPAVEVPEIFARAMQSRCYGYQPGLDARCTEILQGNLRSTTVQTYAGRYPPPYYLIVGWPSLLFPSAAGVHVMRLLSAALSAAFLASAFASARSTSNTGVPVVGVAIATTPIVLFLAGSVNPSGMEIATGIALWASLVALVLGTPNATAARLSARLSARVGIAASALALSRPLSALWVAMTVAVVLAFASRHRLLALARQAVVWFWAGAAVLGALSAGIWIVVANGLQIGSVGGVATSVSSNQIMRQSLGKTGNEVLQMIGTFGWLDTSAPLVTYLAWLTCLGFLAIAGLAQAGRREAMVLVGFALLVVVLPRLIEASQARELGYVWQGRYTLPFAVGLPIVTALLAEELWVGAGPSLTTWFVRSLVAGHVFAFWWALRRNAVGVDGPLWPGDWPSSLTSSALVTAFALTSLAYGWWLVRAARPDLGPGELVSGAVA